MKKTIITLAIIALASSSFAAEFVSSSALKTDLATKVVKVLNTVNNELIDVDGVSGEKVRQSDIFVLTTNDADGTVIKSAQPIYIYLDAQGDETGADYGSRRLSNYVEPAPTVDDATEIITYIVTKVANDATIDHYEWIGIEGVPPNQIVKVAYIDSNGAVLSKEAITYSGQIVAVPVFE